MRSRSKEHTTIIKRAARKEHRPIHGGAWKVAFADFTLAMMALFMVLWIMGAVSEEERREVVSMLNGDVVFEGYALTPLTQREAGGKISLLETRAPEAGPVAAPTKDDVLKKVKQQANRGQSLGNVNARSRMEIEELARIIMEITSAYNAQSNLQLEIVPQGLRILITDDKNREMFQRSSAVLTPFFDRLLAGFAPALASIDNNIIITGHTDATRFRDQERYNNWNLSAERAMQARRVLTHGGLQAERILQVSGMADRVLLDSQDPLSSVNRRIEIMVLTHAASQSLYEFFGQHGEKVLQPLAEKLADKV
ncbi:putative lateral flagellar export/assembly protein LafU [Pluralibacter gergoviae]|uniref:putative lateral flagellar export/assembly protein LafU n=1 Tax=Pluralibacter gergoviae TaxID=61647 RepID=UPI0005EC9377|nr:putative lateral flagellar export/assembly protein LafU [Pluralibacter gergoviae]KJM59177.1 flagellar motor protein B [Pluralibacter gergoviae]OUQ99730.1 putative lateral flagellar export/assembly protein LafU [Pluralibacter gergoviae]